MEGLLSLSRWRDCCHFLGGGIAVTFSVEGLLYLIIVMSYRAAMDRVRNVPLIESQFSSSTISAKSFFRISRRPRILVETQTLFRLASAGDSASVIELATVK
jgi:hypothetical protein